MIAEYITLLKCGKHNSYISKFQNKFTYPKYIYDMRVLPEERKKQSYIKHCEYRRRRKKNRPISLSTIDENYASDSFPRKFFQRIHKVNKILVFVPLLLFVYYFPLYTFYCSSFACLFIQQQFFPHFKHLYESNCNSLLQFYLLRKFMCKFWELQSDMIESSAYYL